MNQCDGCLRGLIIKTSDGVTYHYESGLPEMVCTKDKYDEFEGPPG